MQTPAMYPEMGSIQPIQRSAGNSSLQLEKEVVFDNKKETVSFEETVSLFQTS